MGTPILVMMQPQYPRFVFIDVQRANEFVFVIMVSTHFQVDLPSGFVPKLVSGSVQSTCAVSYGNSTVCWGRNDEGQLGLEHTNPIGDQTDEMGDHMDITDLGADFGSVAQIEATLQGFCAVSTKGSLKCWGENEYGQLGML